MAVFDAARWWSRIVQELNALRGLQGLSEDTGALEYYLDRYNAEGEDLGFLALTDEERRAADAATFLSHDPTECEESAEEKLMLRSALLGHLAIAFNTYRRQTLVVAVTYLEIMTEDFLQAAFADKPSTMYEYMSQWAEQRGKVDLKDVLEAESKERLVESLALKSARLAGQGRFRTVVNNIRKITRREVDQDLIGRLENLAERRNQLVHEDHPTEVSANEADEALMAVMDFASELGRIAKEVDIPVRTVSVEDEWGASDFDAAPFID